MTKASNLRAWVPPAHVADVRSCLAPFMKENGALLEPLLRYALTGDGREAIEEFDSAVNPPEEEDGAIEEDDWLANWSGNLLDLVESLVESLVGNSGTWKTQKTLRVDLLELPVFRDTDDAAVPFAARLLHAISPALVEHFEPWRRESDDTMTKAERRAYAVAKALAARRSDFPLAPYLALLDLLELPEDFVLVEALALHANKRWLAEYQKYGSDPWTKFVDFLPYATRYPQCWRQAFTHKNPQVRIHALRMARRVDECLPELESMVVDCATVSRRDLRTEARGWIAEAPARFENAICVAAERKEAPRRAEAVDLVARFVPPKRALPILEAMVSDRSKKVQKKASAALAALTRREVSAEDDVSTGDRLELEIALDTPLSENVRAAIADLHSRFVGRWAPVPSLDHTLRYVEVGIGEPQDNVRFAEGAEGVLRDLASLEDITLVQYLRCLRFCGLFYPATNDAATHLRVSGPWWVIDAYAKSRPARPCLTSVVAAFEAMGWDARGVAVMLVVDELPVEGWDTAGFIEKRQDDLIEMWRNYESPLFCGGYRDEVLPRLASLCAALPSLPSPLMEAIWEAAVGSAVTLQRPAQISLEHKPGIEARILGALRNKKQGVRSVAATWAAAANLTAAIPVLHEALGREGSTIARVAMLEAIDRLGGSIDPWITPEQLRSGAERGLKKGIPAKLSWFPFESLPVARWEDGDAVDQASLHWLLVQAHALKAPAPGAQLRRVLAKLTEESREELARFVFRAWVDRDGTVEITGPGQYDRKTISAIGDKGLLAVVAASGDAEWVDQARRYIDENYGYKQAQCFALLRMVAAIDVPDSLLLLQRIARRFRTDSIKQAASQIIDEYANARGWSKQEFGDRTTPNGGLDESGSFALSFGQTEFTVELDPQSLLLVIRSADGKVRKSLPKPRVQDDDDLAARAKRQLQRNRKQVKATIADRKAALYEAMCLERRWSLPTWGQYLCAHPVTGLLCRRLVWQCEHDMKKVTFTPVAPNAFIDVHGAPFVPDPDSTISLAHESNVSEPVRALWNARFEDEDIKPLFPQFGRIEAIRRVFPTYTGGLPDVKGLRVDANTFYRRALGGGFVKGPVEDGPTICEFFFRLPDSDLVGVLECSGIDLGLLNSVANTVYETLAGEAAGVELEGLALFRGQDYDRESVDLDTEAPPPLVVEIAAATAKAVGEDLRAVRTAANVM